MEAVALGQTRQSLGPERSNDNDQETWWLRDEPTSNDAEQTNTLHNPDSPELRGYDRSAVALREFAKIPKRRLRRLVAVVCGSCREAQTGSEPAV
jgi:hypothetical protein